LFAVLCRLESAELEGLLAWRHERAQLIREDALKDVMSDFLSDSDDDVAVDDNDEMQTLEEHFTAQVSLTVFIELISSTSICHVQLDVRTRVQQISCNMHDYSPLCHSGTQ
jgi:hypothetical protein